MQNKGPDEFSPLTANGRVTLLRRHYHAPGAGTQTPSDDLLDRAHASISLATRQLCCQLNRAARSFAMAAQNLQHAAQLSLSTEVLRQVVEAEGQAVLKASQCGDLSPTWHAQACQGADGRSRVYLSSDGFMAPTLTDAEKQARRRKVMAKRKTRKGRKRRLLPVKRGTDQRYKEFKAVMFYDQGLEHKLVSVTRGKCKAAGKLMRRDAYRLGFAAADQRVGNIDGGPWIIRQIQQQRLPMTAVGLDFFHLAENVHKTRRIVFGEENEKGRRWAQDVLHTVKHQGYEPLRQKLMETRLHLRGARRKEMDRLIEYVSDRREMIRYPQFIAQGWLIGSGAMESQCRIVPDRVKGAGQRWDSDNAEAIMALEAMHQSDQCSQYWRLALSGTN